METLERLEWSVDSSALPRPQYPWDAVRRDWSTTPRTPYRPSRADYRRPGTPARRILEIPITTVPLEAPDDTQPGILRYINPAYHGDVFRAALARVPEGVEPVLIAHPYEFLSGTRSHPLIAFDASALRRNLALLADRGGASRTVSEALTAQADPPAPVSVPRPVSHAGDA
jgi:hypothetical protein